MARRRKKKRWSELPPQQRSAIVAVGVVVVFHGMHLPAEARIQGTAWLLAQSLGVCQSVDPRL